MRPPPQHPTPSLIARHTERLRRLGFRRFSAGELLIAMVLLFVATPFLEGFVFGAAIEALLMTAVLVSAVLAVGGRRRTLLWTSLMVVPAVVCRWVTHIRPDLLSPAPYLVTALLFMIFVVVRIVQFVLRTPRVNGEVLCASISAYLLLGLSWAFAYRLVGDLVPGAFAFNGPASMHGFTAFYFSFVTLSTVGYGDITPVADVARMLAVLESMTGPLYLAVLIARLVALYSVPPAASPPGAEES